MTTEQTVFLHVCTALIASAPNCGGSDPKILLASAGKFADEILQQMPKEA